MGFVPSDAIADLGSNVVVLDPLAMAAIEERAVSNRDLVAPADDRAARQGEREDHEARCLHVLDRLAVAALEVSRRSLPTFLTTAGTSIGSSSLSRIRTRPSTFVGRTSADRFARTKTRTEHRVGGPKAMNPAGRCGHSASRKSIL
jgi:hypothetical protein